MNLVASAPLWLLIVLGCAVAAAAIEDAMRLRISNLTILIVLISAIIAAIAAGPALELWQNAAVFVLILALGTMAFSGGWLGGGDVKLLAAAGLWFDLHSALGFIVAVFLSGGVVALCYLASRPFRRRAASMKNTRIPYGIAIAVGMFTMILLDRGTNDSHQRPDQFFKIVQHRD